MTAGSITSNSVSLSKPLGSKLAGIPDGELRPWTQSQPTKAPSAGTVARDNLGLKFNESTRIRTRKLADSYPGFGNIILCRDAENRFNNAGLHRYLIARAAQSNLFDFRMKKKKIRGFGWRVEVSCNFKDGPLLQTSSEQQRLASFFKPLHAQKPNFLGYSRRHYEPV